MRVIDVPNSCVLEIENLINKYPYLKSSYALIGFQKRMSKNTLDNRKYRYFASLYGITQTELIKRLQEKENLFDAEVPYFTWHDLRHTHVSTLIDIGWEAKDISERLGHSVHEVNETYGHLFPKRKKEMFDKLNSL